MCHNRSILLVVALCAAAITHSREFLGEYYIPINNSKPDVISLMTKLKDKKYTITIPVSYPLGPVGFGPETPASGPENKYPEYAFRYSYLKSSLSVELGFNYFSGNYSRAQWLAILEASKFRYGNSIRVATETSYGDKKIQALLVPSVGVAVRAEFAVEDGKAEADVNIKPLTIGVQYSTFKEHVFFRAMGFTNYHSMQIDSNSEGKIDGAQLRSEVIRTLESYMEDIQHPESLRERVLGYNIQLFTE